MRWYYYSAGIAAAVMSLSASSALANDGVAAMGAGGIVLIETADIRMVSEDLSIGMEKVQVRYEFRNESAAAITTRVAFPLPKMNLVDIDLLGFERLAEKPANPIDFHVKIDGQDVQPETERKATFKGKDVTAFLVQHGVSLDYPDKNFRAKLSALSPAAKQALKARGLADFRFDASAFWTVQHIFHWMQTFPTGRIVNVEHDYKPVVGWALGSFGGEPGLIAGQLRNDDHAKAFCIDERGAKGIARRLKDAQKRQEGASLSAAFIDYILTTGASWKGTIGHFKLTVDKGRPGDLVSLCMGGMRKTGPTTFVATRRNFEPKRDLRILIVRAAE